jgi:ribonuclease HI
MSIKYAKNTRDIGSREVEDLARQKGENAAKLRAALREWQISNPKAYAAYLEMDGAGSSRLKPSKGPSQTQRKPRKKKVEVQAPTTPADVIAYVDGSCRGNPGAGGWGVLLKYGRHQKELCGGDPQTTNNRMELMAAICALEALTRSVSIEIITDSMYVKRGITEWMLGWKDNNWKTKTGHPVKNQDLWSRLDKACSIHDVRWVWVKGHSGVSGNERADALARLGVPVCST